MHVLGIETSCDETAAAIVSRDKHGAPQILSNIVLSQIDEHEAFGGVVPELAARAHLLSLDRVIQAALTDAGIEFDQLDAIAATAGPGLIGGLLVGMMTGKALSASLDLPFIAINHLEGHALTARLTHDISYPYFLLLVSGGHTQIINVRGLGKYNRLATTIDDALGEAFDKTAKLLGLGFPGGPQVERHAISGDPKRFVFPRPLSGRDTLNFSFSGLKTAVRQRASALAPLSENDIDDICASFQQAITDTLVDRVTRTIESVEAQNLAGKPRRFVVAGGVAANASIRSALETACSWQGWEFIAPPAHLCSDNGAMIAWAGLERLEAGLLSKLDEMPHPRWPLDQETASIIGAGKRGAKA